MRVLTVAVLLSVSCRAPAPRLAPVQIVRAAGWVQPGDAWPAVYPAMVEQLGLPTRVSGATYSWAARDGPDCYLIEIRTRGEVVAYVDDPLRPVSDARDGYRRCARAAE